MENSKNLSFQCGHGQCLATKKLLCKVKLVLWLDVWHNGQQYMGQKKNLGMISAYALVLKIGCQS